MVARKMTFSLTDELARTFVNRVPSRERSRFVEEALKARLLDEEADLIRACHAANSDPVAATEEAEWDKVQDDIEEPWVS